MTWSCPGRPAGRPRPPGRTRRGSSPQTRGACWSGTACRPPATCQDGSGGMHGGFRGLGGGGNPLAGRGGRRRACRHGAARRQQRNVPARTASPPDGGPGRAPPGTKIGWPVDHQQGVSCRPQTGDAGRTPAQTPASRARPAPPPPAPPLTPSLSPPLPAHLVLGVRTPSMMRRTPPRPSTTCSPSYGVGAKAPSGIWVRGGLADMPEARVVGRAPASK